jgi:hypothetical protein
MRRHAELLVAADGELSAMRAFRKHVAWYLKGFAVGGATAAALGQVSTLAELDTLLATLDLDQPFPAQVVGRAARAYVRPAARRPAGRLARGPRGPGGAGRRGDGSIRRMSSQGRTNSAARAPRRGEARAWRDALPPWVVAHLLAALALGMVAVWYGIQQTGEAPGAHGIWVWDGGWYRWIGTEGYDGVPRDGIRFFPLLPMLGRLLGPLLGGVGPALLLVSAVAALGYLAQLLLLVRDELGDSTLARRSAWFAALLPGAGILVLPYTEPVALLLAVGFFRALRRGNLPLVVALGISPGWRGRRACSSPRRRSSSSSAAARRASATSSREPARSRRRWSAPGSTWAGSRSTAATACCRTRSRPAAACGAASPPTPGPPVPLHAVRAEVAAPDLPRPRRARPARRRAAATSDLVRAWSALTIAAAVTTSDGHSMPRYLAGPSRWRSPWPW